MFYGLVNLAWFDLITVGITFFALIVVQVINALWHISHEDGKNNVKVQSDQVDDSKNVTCEDDDKVTKSLKINNFKSVASTCETQTTPTYLPTITSNAGAATPPLGAVGVPPALTNAKLQKQQSEQCENGSSTSSASFATHVSSSSATLPSSYASSLTFASPSALPSSSSASNSSSSSTYPLTFRHSIGGLLNGNTGNTLPHYATSCFPDHLSDEYHEDEDTISLENLLPCDHTEIFSSRKISYIIDELLQTEGNYVTNLKRGMQNYGTLQKYDKLPDTLRGDDKQRHLLGNIVEILDLHEKQILPLMVGNQRDLKTLFDEMSSHIEKHHFDCYVTFTMNKKTSMQLRKDNREWFQNYQSEINDRLGIDSFLVQPIQRLTRYPLLLQQFISEFYKTGINCKPVLVSVCKLETRLRRLLEVVNQSEEVLSIDELPTELSIQSFGPFRRSTEFEAHNLRQRKKFKAKVFLFDQYLICVEVRKRRLAYRSHYTWDAIDLKLNTPKSVSVLLKAAPSGAGSTGSFKSSGGKSSRENSIREEYEFTSGESSAVAQWLRSARKIIENVRIVESQKGKITLPMDLVLGAVFAIWFIWLYL